MRAMSEPLHAAVEAQTAIETCVVLRAFEPAGEIFSDPRATRGGTEGSAKHQ